jgi:hypothetical protein
VAKELETTQAIEPQVLNQGDQVITLPSGRVAVIREGTMADLEAAQVESGGKQQKVLAFLITRLVTIDGQPLTYEQYRTLSLKDGTMIVNTVSKQFPEGES